MTTDESAKQRARRIPLDYYKRLTGLEAAKWFLTTLVSIGAGAYILWTLSGWFVGTPGSARQFSPGPVVSAHAAWDADCAACHVPGTNLRHDAAAISLVSSLVGGPAVGDHSQIDGKCQSCHAGEPHHASQMTSEVRSCAGCHYEHQGRSADLTRVSDTVCTTCHANIKAHRAGETGALDQDVTAFPGSHPKFRSLTRTDPGKLKFNHRLHLLPGQYPTGVKTPEESAGHSKRVPVIEQLSCEFCHEPDSSARAGNSPGGRAVPASGAYMQPINFERHCAACHNGDLVAEVQGPETLAAQQVPHGIRAAAIRELLIGLASPLTQPPRISPSQPLTRIPGRTPGENLAQTTQLDTATRVEQAAERLTGEARCGKCHVYEPLKQPADPLPPEVVPPNLPSVWLPHAKFDHAAHRAMQCFECHDRQRLVTSETGVKPPLDHPAPIIDDIDKCQQCHAPTTAWGTAGARHDCAECHRYHGGDRLPHGRGDPARGVPAERRHESREWMMGRSE